MRALVLTRRIVVIEVEARLPESHNLGLPREFPQARVGVRGDRLAIVRMDADDGEDVCVLPRERDRLLIVGEIASRTDDDKTGDTGSARPFDHRLPVTIKLRVGEV